MEHTSVSAGSAWPLGIRIRPPVDGDATHVEVADTVTGRRFRWSPDALSAHILRDGAPGGAAGPAEPTGNGAAWRRFVESAGDRGHLVDGWRHWWRRRWYPSDQYYQASRRWRFADVDDHDESVRASVVRHYLTTDGPPVEEDVPDGPRTALPAPAPVPAVPLTGLLVKRRSGRDYRPAPVPAEWLSGLLWHGLSGIRARRERTGPDQPLSYLDSYGSAWDFHVCVFAVDGIAPGAYRYDIRTNELVSVRAGEHRAAMARILQGMSAPATAAWTLGLVADFPRYQWRYRHEHGLRRLYYEAGIIGQELTILAGGYGLSTLVTPAQQDGPYLDLHGLSSDRYAPVYTLTMGRSRSTNAGGGPDAGADANGGGER
jgi:nitroreductase